MARSPLFQALRRIARRARAAAAPAAAPPEQAGTGAGPSRRDVLFGSLGAAALLPLAQACGDNHGGDTPSIAIIGAGIAGLTAAHFLEQAGVRADVYEASMRAGGRMYTARGILQGGQLAELGGELVDSDHVVIPTLLELYGQTLDDLPAATAGLAQDVFHFGGAAIPEATLVAEFTPVAAKMELAVTAGDADEDEFARIDAMSIPEWLETEAGLPATSLIRRVLELAYLEEFGLEVEEQSAWNLITLIDYETPDPFRIFGDSDERFHPHQGCDALPVAMAERLADLVHLDHALTKVERVGETFELTFARSGESPLVVQVDHVIYALPFTKLREVDLSGAALSEEKRTIIAELGYGTNAKLMLQFSSRPWEVGPQAAGSCITDTGQLQTTWATSARPGGRAGHPDELRRRRPRRRDGRRAARGPGAAGAAVDRDGVPRHVGDVPAGLGAAPALADGAVREGQLRLVQGRAVGVLRPRGRARGQPALLRRALLGELPGLHGGAAPRPARSSRPRSSTISMWTCRRCSRTSSRWSPRCRARATTRASAAG